MSQDCWGPSPEDFARVWQWKSEHAAEVKRVGQEMEDSLRKTMGRRKMTLDEIWVALDAKTDYTRKEAFRGRFWSWWNRGMIEQDSKGRFHYVFNR